MCFIIPGVLGLVLLVVLILFWGTPTTTTTPAGPPGDCLIWGDPHVETFDHGFPNFYEEGEFWVVKRPLVWIQGRYLATPFTNGLSATHQIAVGGPLWGATRALLAPWRTGRSRWTAFLSWRPSPPSFATTPVAAF